MQDIPHQVTKPQFRRWAPPRFIVRAFRGLRNFYRGTRRRLKNLLCSPAPTSKTRILGTLGEFIAAQYLNLIGYAVVDRNYRSPAGEIDIIALRGGVLYIVEVKTRSLALHRSFQFDSAVADTKLEHLLSAGRSFRRTNSITLRRLQVKRTKYMLVGVSYGTVWPFIKVSIRDERDITEKHLDHWRLKLSVDCALRDETK